MPMNNDLISRSALKKYMFDCLWEFSRSCDFAKAVEMVERAPAVDAVEVVRCKDCIKRGNDERCPMLTHDLCLGHTDLTQDNGFCDRGERRADDEDLQTQ